MKSKALIGIIAAVVIVGGIVYAATRHKTPTTTPSTTSSSTNTPAASSSSTTAAAVITYSANGFSPASTTITSGQSVTFTNSSSSDIQVDSNPHPAHTDDTDLNIGSIAAGQSKTVTLTKKGSFGFHNHLDPSMTANITVQ